MILDLHAQVFDCNRRFYEAFQRADCDAMADVWLHENWVKCVHPGWPMIVGWPPIADSWRHIFNGHPALDITIETVSGHIEPLTAWITCIERVQKQSLIQATNVFLFRDDEWKIIHHHASATPGAPVTSPPPISGGAD